MKRNFFQLLCVVYGLLFIAYSLWTYFLTDPNLIIATWKPYLILQEWMWKVDSSAVTILYVALINAIFFVYFLIIQSMQNTQLNTFSLKALFFKQKDVTIVRLVGITLCVCIVALLFSYNALSHDVFNYMFNAKMVVEYNANPHIQTALDFAPDDWLRFMHNVHTPAPYWYGWTVVSVFPYVLGIGKFITTWLAFRIWSVVGFALLILALSSLVQKVNKNHPLYWVLLFALNPLVLIELVSNSHNDSWMMWPAMLSISLLFLNQLNTLKKGNLSGLIIVSSFGLLLFSLSIKIVTVLLIPFWVYIFLINTKFGQELRRTIDSFSNKLKVLRIYFDKHLFDFMSLTLFVPLLTQRAQQFHPWYLVWSFSFLPLLKWSWWRNALLIVSVSSLLRYVPWMWSGAYEYTSEIQLQQKMITWLPFVIYVLYRLFLSTIQKIKLGSSTN